MTALPQNKEGKKLVREVLRNNPSASTKITGRNHIRVSCPGLPSITLAGSPGKSNHVHEARRDFRKAGYRLDA